MERYNLLKQTEMAKRSKHTFEGYNFKDQAIAMTNPQMQMMKQKMNHKQLLTDP